MYLLNYFQHFQEVILCPFYVIFLSHFHGYNKNEIFVDYWETQNVFKCCHI
jgi:hypothetical protein